MAETLRAFVAFKLPQETVSCLSDVTASLMSFDFGIRWIPAENIHVTLKFLGDVGQKAIGPIAEALCATAAGQRPISFRAKGLGVFPGIRRPRVIWAGLSGETERLMECQRALDTQLAMIGFPREKRPFRSHLTLGRVRGKIAPEKLLGAIKQLSAFESAPVTADRMILYRSELKRSGALYTVLAEAPFG